MCKDRIPIGDSLDGQVRELLASGRVSEAEALVRRAVAEHPGSGGARAWLARVMYRSGRLDEAGEHAREALRLEPGQPVASVVLGQTLMARHRWGEAADVLGRPALTARCGAVQLRGMALYMDDAFTQAAQAWQSLLDLLAPADPSRTGIQGRLVLAKALASRRPYARTGALPVWLEFLPGRDLPTVGGKVNGVEASLLIDTGASEVCLRRSFARQLGITGLEGAAPAGGVFAGGTEGPVEYAIIDRLDLGGIQVRDVPAQIIGPDDEPERRYESVLGTQLLRRFRTTFAYTSNRLVLEDPLAAAAPSSSALSVPFFTLFDHYSIVYGRLEGGPEEPIFVDSGGTFGVAVTGKRFGEAYGDGVPTRTMTGRSAVGPLDYREFRVTRLSLGAVEERDLVGVLDVFEEEVGNSLGFAIHLLVSHDFLRRYSVTWDYGAGVLLFSK